MHKGKTCDRIIEISPVNTDALRGPTRTRESEDNIDIIYYLTGQRGPTRTRESEGKSYGTPPNQNDPQSGVSDPEG